ncbi:MAG TPA: transporter, partial [Pyrinomonadaceae bacterium]|nr:transporter [Pyrinomonadaceae bacterium]
KQFIQLGIVGYSEFQLTNDSGTGVTAANLDAKDSVHALGGEFGLILPTKKLNFMVRVLPEYGAHSRTQGVTIAMAIVKSF